MHVAATPTSFALDVVRMTEAAARAAAAWVGRGDKDAVDGAAVRALEEQFEQAPFAGRIVVGEGEKDEAPLLAPGKRLGPEDLSAFDVAVDPVDGTRLAAAGRPGALAVMALAPRGALFDLSAAYYLEKIVAPARARAALSLDADPRDTLQVIAEALGKPPGTVTVAVQDRPRHEGLIASLHEAGARVERFGDADLSWAVDAARPDRSVDVLWGIGGAPEGLLAACAMKMFDGALIARLHPRSQAERVRLDEAGLDAEAVFFDEDLVASDDVVLALTGITPGRLVDGVGERHGHAVTSSFLLTGRPPAARFLQTWHEASGQ